MIPPPGIKSAVRCRAEPYRRAPGIQSERAVHGEPGSAHGLERPCGLVDHKTPFQQARVVGVRCGSTLRPAVDAEVMVITTGAEEECPRVAPDHAVEAQGIAVEDCATGAPPKMSRVEPLMLT